MMREAVKRAFDDAELILAREELARVADEPSYHFSTGFEKRMDRVCRRMEQGKSPVISRTVKILLVAAIVAALLAATTMAVMHFTYEFRHMHGYSQFISKNREKVNSVGDIQIDFIPDGYTLTVTSKTDLMAEATYENNNGQTIQFIKEISQGGFLDNETLSLTEIRRNGTLYVTLRDGDYCGITWMDSKFEYTILCFEYFSDDMLFKLADGFH